MTDEERKGLRDLLALVADLYRREGPGPYTEDRAAWTEEERENVRALEDVERKAEEVRRAGVIQTLLSSIDMALVDSLLDQVDVHLSVCARTEEALAERVDLRGETLRAVCAHAIGHSPTSALHPLLLSTPTLVTFTPGGGESREMVWVTCDVGIPVEEIQDAARLLSERHALQRAQLRRGVLQGRPALLVALGLPHNWAMPVPPREGLVAYFRLRLPGGKNAPGTTRDAPWLWAWEGWWGVSPAEAAAGKTHPEVPIPWPFPPSAHLWEDEIVSLGFTPVEGRRGVRSHTPTRNQS